MRRPSLAAAALGMLSLAHCQLASAFLHAAPRHATRAALLKARSPQQPLGRAAGLTRMMATVAPPSIKKLSSPQEELLKDVSKCCGWFGEKQAGGL
jgi:hypothetical protein